MKRFQDCNWIVKLWRYRWYLEAYYKFALAYLYNLNLSKESIRKYKEEGFYLSNKNYLAIYIGLAQAKMNWLVDGPDLKN